MYMKSENGEIEVFLCPEESTQNNGNSEATSRTTNEPTPSCSAVGAAEYSHQQTISVPSTSGSLVGYNTTEDSAVTHPSNHMDLGHTQISHNFMVKDEPMSEDVESVSGLSRIHNVLISESDDFEPMGGGRFQLQTEDQHNSHISGEKLYSLYCSLTQ
jgi:transcription factor E2F2